MEREEVLMKWPQTPPFAGANTVLLLKERFGRHAVPVYS